MLAHVCWLCSSCVEVFPYISSILVLAAVLSWLNHRTIRLPTTIGVMAIALVASLAMFGLEALGVDIRSHAVSALGRFEFSSALLEGMLAFLLFAGALHVDLDDLLGHRFAIGLLATIGVLVTTVLVGFGAHTLFGLLGIDVGLGPCLLFGALISPTDPIAVMSILKSAGVPRSLETKIAGESLFNDGIGVVVFTVLLASLATGAAEGGHSVDVSGIAEIVVREVPLSLLLGFATGWIAYRMLRAVDDYHVEVLVTLALAMGTYSLAVVWHGSGPLAVVVAGIFVGNTGRRYAMSKSTCEHIDTFWELIDEILNAVLFVLIGLEVLVVEFTQEVFMAGLLCVPMILVARFCSVGATLSALRRRREFTPHAVKVMTWAGLRGGISVALALSIPAEAAGRDVILAATYVVVLFSILVQGLTVGPLVRRLGISAP